MKASVQKLFASILIATYFAQISAEHKQYVYLKAVQCQPNPKFCVNVSCFAKSYSRTISKMTIQTSILYPLTVVMVDFKMQYKYGTIYRQVLGIPVKFDWCYAMSRVEEMKKDPLGNELYKILNEGAPGFIRPCPWKEFRLRNFTIGTTNLVSIWPTGDYKVMFYSFSETGESFMNVTLIGSFRTPLKETFG